VLRNTRQRDAIKKAFADSARPLEPKEILTTARKYIRGLGIATVYRTVKAMIDDETLRVVNLPGQPTRYELRSPIHHHHFECKRCGKVYEADCWLKNLRRMAPKGTRLESHEVILYGRCVDCAN
jgi:Fur family ferric uptake transcriptional regulator